MRDDPVHVAVHVKVHDNVNGAKTAAQRRVDRVSERNATARRI
jgi:hypothetical protein